MTKQNDTPIEIPGLEFDFSAVTSQEWTDMVDATNAPDITSGKRLAIQAQFLARVTAALPAGWNGDPDEPDTYLHLRQFDQYEPLINAMWEAVGEARKKARARYTTA